MRPITRRTVAAALAAAGLLVAAGCAGDDPGASTSAQTTAALSAEVFRERADAICSDIRARLDALDDSSSPDDDLTTFFERGLALEREQITRLRGLVPPAELTADFDAALGLLAQKADVLTRAKDRIAGGEAWSAVIGALDRRITDLEGRAAQRATDMGLTECGRR